MRHKMLVLASLVIPLLLFIAAGIAPVSAHGSTGYGHGCQRHYVRRGETLSSIGRQYGVSWQGIARANGLPNPNLIRAGSVLCIPSASQPSYGYSQPSHGYNQPSYGYSQPSYGNRMPMAPNGYRAGGYAAGDAPYRSRAYTGGATSYGNSSSAYDPAYPSLPATHTYGRAVVVVQVRNSQFVPKTVTIQAGDTVTWMRVDGAHSVHADDGSFANRPGNTWHAYSQTFTTPGTVPYYCEVHGGPGGAGMSGVIVVQ